MVISLGEARRKSRGGISSEVLTALLTKMPSMPMHRGRVARFIANAGIDILVNVARRRLIPLADFILEPG
ncbi:hypothetical protein C2L65_30385 [Paraburkholderia terrae]|uniref:Uncharacterized protein n=1 Tax=Paraburkholderia terrae TaxID=311230 RepID=A0A2I8EX44_9BURK|nr:hypothetical protein C2L65_30385 [Paraburkholderia terrae]